jgi:hypothetical protein
MYYKKEARRNSREQNNRTEIKKWLTGRLDIVEERISEVEDISIETTKIKKQKKKRFKKNCGRTTQSATNV